MPVLAQCGYGKSDKIESGLAEGIIHGAILSPRDERRERLEESLRQWHRDHSGKTYLFDPQFYAAALNAPKDGHLNEYNYYNENSGLGRTRFTQAKIKKYVSDCLNYQTSIIDCLTYYVSPNVSFEGFKDNWSQISINMAAEACDCYQDLSNPKGMLISQIFSENALKDRIGMEEYLDALTELEVEGFYVIVNRNANSLQHAMDSSAFANLLYFCYTLALNEYKVMVGYSDWLGFILESVGVDSTASGWYQNLKQFSMDRFQPREGGKRPRKRYSSQKLINCPMLSPDLQDIYEVGLLSEVLGGYQYDNLLTGGPAAGNPQWTDPISCATHWYSLTQLTEALTGYTGPEKMKKTIEIIENANRLYSRLAYNNIQIDSTHLDDWRDSIEEFCKIVSWNL